MTSVQPEEVAEPIEIEAQHNVYSVAFLADGKHVVSGDYGGTIRRWRVEDGKEEGLPMNAESGIRSIAVSHDSKRIVSGTNSGMVVVWETGSNKKRLELEGHKIAVFAVDVSPDGTRIGPWQHDFLLSAVKFSPDGLLVTTATWRRESIRVYDSRNGKLLVDFEISVKSWLNESLAWANSYHLFALSVDGNVNCLDVSAGTTRFRWPIHGSSDPRCIVLAANGLFIAASDESSVSFWDTATREQIGPVIHHTSRIESMAISVNFDLVLVMAGSEKFTLIGLRGIVPSYYLPVEVQWPQRLLLSHDLQVSEPANPEEAQEKGFSELNGILNIIHVSDTTLELWRKDKLLEAIDVVSREKRKFNDQSHHMLATRAFLRGRLRQWSLAIQDAQESIDIQPNILAYIAIGMARLGRGDVESAKEAFNQLLRKCNADDVFFIFLVKAIVMFIFGHYQEGMVRVAGLIINCLEQERASYHAIQTHMRLMVVKACIGRQEYDKALELLADLHDPPQFINHPQLECISLMFGWTFDSDTFGFMLYQQRCEALRALGRQNEAAALLDAVWKDLEPQSVSGKEAQEWLQEFRREMQVI